MTQPIGDVLDEGFVAAAQRQQAIGELTVGDLVAGADVVDLAGDAAPQYQIDAGTVVFDEAPVAHVQPIAVQRHLASVEQVGHEQRNDLFGVLIGPEVVGRATDDHGQPVGLEIREGDEIGRGLGRGIRRARPEHITFAERAHIDRTVNLVGRDVQEPFDAEPPRHVAQDVGAAAVGADERVGVDDRAIDVALRRKMNHRVVALHRVADRAAIADVAFDERETGVIFEIAQAGEIAGVCERVVDGDLIVAGREDVTRVVGSDETGGAGDEESHQVPFTCAANGAVATAARCRDGEGWPDLDWIATAW